MKGSRVVAAICGALLLSSLALGQGSTPRKITVVAHKYAFEPSHLELKVGEPVEITFESQDKKHGFSCKDLTPEKIEFDKDKPATITITPQTAGTYRFKCAHWCGFGHGKMKGEIVVAP
jgi:heme/copper-type cytochrome/quinol oxidase subunit 2